MSQFVSSAATQQQGSTEKNAKTKKEQSADQKNCGAAWKETKASNKIEKGTTWPKFWSACNKRLKSAAN